MGGYMDNALLFVVEKTSSPIVIVGEEGDILYLNNAAKNIDIQIALNNYKHSNSNITNCVWNGKNASLVMLEQPESKILNNEYLDDFSSGIILLDVSWKILESNKTIHDIIGYDISDIYKADFKSIVHDDDKNKHVDTFIHKQVIRLIHKNGDIIWTLINISEPKDINGSIYIIINIQDITKYKLIEEEANTFRRNMIAAIEGGTDGFVMFSPEDKLVLWNQHFIETLPKIKEQIHHGMNAEQLISYIADTIDLPNSEEKKKWFKWRLEKYHNPGKSFEVKTKDGRWFLARDYRTNDGYRILFRTEITLLKERELAFIKSEQKFKAIFNNSYQFIGLLDKNGILLEANNSSLEFISSSLEDVVGKYFWETPWWTHNSHQQQNLQSTVIKACKGEFVRFETTHKNSDGEEIVIDFSLKPILSDFGDVIMIIPEGRNITSIKKIEDELAHNLSFIRTLSDTLNTPFFAKDIDGRYTFCNKAFAEIANVDQDKIIGNKYSELNLNNGLYADIHENIDKKVINNGEAITYEAISVSKKSGKRDTIVSKSPHRNNKGEIIGLVAVITDVTDINEIRTITKSREHLKAIIESMSHGVTVIDDNMDIIITNKSFMHIFCIKNINNNVYTNLRNIIDYNLTVNDALLFYSNLEDIIVKNINNENNTKIIRSEYSLLSGKTLEIIVGHIPDGRFIITYNDITEIKETSKKFQNMAYMMDEIVSSSSIILWSFDSNGIYSFVRGSDKVIGYSPSEVLGCNFNYFMHKDDNYNFITETKTFNDILICYKHKLGHDVWLSFSGNPVYNESDTIIGYSGIAIDVTSTRLKDLMINELITKLQEAALHDPLTNLANRTKFASYFDEEIVKRNNCYDVSLLVIDIDHFKQVNDTYGHLAGDEVLKNIATILLTNIRETDLPCRFGGEEFIVLLPKTNLKNALDLANRIRITIENSPTKITWLNNYINVTASFGVACMCADKEIGMDNLIEKADQAAYKAKHDGRNRVCATENNIEFCLP